MNKRGRIAPTTAMIGNECGRTNVGTLTASRWIGVDALNHSLSSDRVASHERNPRKIASATPIAEIAASTPSFRVTVSFVVWGSCLRYDGIRRVAIATMAITGGPMRITNRISARVLAEHFHSSRFDTRAMPEATSVAVALMVNSSARTSVIPSSSYIDY